MKPDETQSIKRLRQQIQELQQRWDLLSQKITQLEQQRIVETRIEEKIRLKKTIADAEAERNQVEQHLKALESRLRMEAGKGRFFIPIEPTLPPEKLKMSPASKGNKTADADHFIVNFSYRYRILKIVLSFGITLLVPFLFYSIMFSNQPIKLIPNQLNKERSVIIITKIGAVKVPSQVWQIVHNEPKYRGTTPYLFQGEPGKQIDYELRFNGNNRSLTLTMPEDENLECVYQMDDSWRFQQPANQNPYCQGATEVRSVPTD